MRKVVTLIFVLLMVLFSISGCRSVGEKAAEKIAEKAIENAAESEGEDVDVDLSEEKMTIKTDEGEVNIGKGVELPDGFPSTVPVHPDLEIVTSMNEGEESFMISALYSKGSGDEIFDWYKNELSSSGWEITDNLTIDSDEGKTSSLGASNGEYDLSVSVMDAGEEVSVMIGVDKCAE